MSFGTKRFAVSTQLQQNPTLVANTCQVDGKVVAEMPGRQSTGPPKSSIKAKAKRQKPQRALDALAIAEQEHPRKNKIRQSRLGDSEDLRSTRREDGDSGDEAQEGRSAASKSLKRGEKDRFGNEIEVGSDSSGNEWVIGQVDKEDDSELDSDEAFGGK